MHGVFAFRRVVVTAITAALVAMAIGGVSLARAGGSHASNHTLRFTETQTASTFVDISHSKNGKPGDEFIFHSKLTKPSGGATVGSLDVVCTLVFGGHAQCLGTAKLHGGTLSVTALVSINGNPPTSIAVNGGTGKFAKVRGDGLSTSTGANTDDDVFHLNY
jgi:hypothetical protein